ncbi:MAG: hypothetical protein R3D62_07080 [Xanthobacteraceae bacterium]
MDGVVAGFDVGVCSADAGFESPNIAIVTAVAKITGLLRLMSAFPPGS